MIGVCFWPGEEWLSEAQTCLTKRMILTKQRVRWVMATSNTKFSINTGLQLLFLVLVFRSFFDDIATVTKESEANEHSIEKSFSPNREMVYNKSTTAKNHVCVGCQPKTLPTDIWKRVNGRKLQKTEKIIMNCFLKKKKLKFQKKNGMKTLRVSRAT